MRDRFRFRAWNKIKQIYDYDIQECQKISLHNSNKEKCFACFQSYLKNQDILEIEQCTGLKDKNGKLIYEGDIVDDGEKYSKIIFDKSCFCYDSGNGCYDDLVFYHTHCEIVGNIHKNPELLEEDK